MTTVAITVSPTAALGARLAIAVSGAAVGETMTVTRRVGTRVPAVVMGGTAIPAESVSVLDPEVPLNRAATWVVTTSSGVVVESSALTVSASLAVVSDPVAGLLARCAVVERDALERVQRASQIQVEGDPTLWVVWDVPVGQTMPVSLLTLTREADDSMDAVLATGAPVLLRCVCGFHDDRWVQPVEKTSRARVVVAPDNPRRLWDLGSCVVYPGNPRLSESVRRATLGDVFDAVSGSTLGAIADRWATLGAIAEGL